MGGDAEFGDAVHALGADLQLDTLADGPTTVVWMDGSRSAWVSRCSP
jgi:hypothetical protein